MTLEQADICLKYKTKILTYNQTRVFSLSPADVAELDAVCMDALKLATNWYCGGCAVERVTQLVAEAENAYAQYSAGISNYDCAK